MNSRKNKQKEKFKVLISGQEFKRGNSVGYFYIDYLFKNEKTDHRNDNNFCIVTELIQEFYHKGKTGYNNYFEVNMN